jgi:hypothetical protein
VRGHQSLSLTRSSASGEPLTFTWGLFILSTNASRRDETRTDVLRAFHLPLPASFFLDRRRCCATDKFLATCETSKPTKFPLPISPAILQQCKWPHKAAPNLCFSISTPQLCDAGGILFARSTPSDSFPQIATRNVFSKRVTSFCKTFPEGKLV